MVWLLSIFSWYSMKSRKEPYGFFLHTKQRILLWLEIKYNLYALLQNLKSVLITDSLNLIFKGFFPPVGVRNILQP